MFESLHPEQRGDFFISKEDAGELHRGQDGPGSLAEYIAALAPETPPGERGVQETKGKDFQLSIRAVNKPWSNFKSKLQACGEEYSKN